MCVCLPPLWGVAFGKADFKHVTLLIGVEITCHSVTYLYMLRKVKGLWSTGQLRDTHFQLASSHVQNIVAKL